MHFAVSKQTAAEIIYDRANSEKENMGLTSWKNSPNGKILESDVIIAKNYLSKEEIGQLERIVSAFLDLAEARAKRNIPMTMEDWSTRIDKFLLADDRNRYDFIKFEEAKEREYFKNLDWIINYNQVKELSENEIIELINQIEKELEETVEKCDLLKFKIYSLRDILLFKQGYIPMELPEENNRGKGIKKLINKK